MNPEPRTSLRAARVWLTGASSGIGAALVTKLVERGARVAVTARRVDLLDALAAGHASRGSPLLVVPADVTDPAAVAAAAQRIESEWGGIDLAIFNAGGSVAGAANPRSANPQSAMRQSANRQSAMPQSAIRDPQFDAHAYEATMALNYFSVVYGIEAVLPGMLARGSGHIAAVASLAGYRPTTVALPYSAAKAAVIHLIEGLRLSTASRGIAFTIINPGFVRTPLTARHTFRMPFLVEADDAAERIVRGLERSKREIHFPAPLSWTMKFMRLLPGSLYARIISRAAPK